MNFGVCLSMKSKDRIKTVKDLGGKFIEVSFQEIAGADSEALADFGGFLKETGILCLAANGMFPGSLKLTGDAVDYGAIDGYIEKTCEKAKTVGLRTVVFGSGGARNVPEGFSREKASEQLILLCAEHISPIFARYGMVCAIEPLNRQECNILNTCVETMDIIRSAAKPNIRLLVDYYHFTLEDEAPESLIGYAGYIAHVHIGGVKSGRKFPFRGDGEDYGRFFRALKASGYAGGMMNVSVEAGCADFAADLKEAFACMSEAGE